MKRSIAFAAVTLAAALLLGGCATSSETAMSDGTQTYAAARKGKKTLASAQQPNAVPRDPWVMYTPFGIIYSQTPRAIVPYSSSRTPGSIIVDTRNRYLYYVLGHDQAVRYSIAVGAEGYGWSGVSTVSAKREWPDWTPTPDILRRFPNLPRHMPGGRDNPLGARALYLGSTLYRIHGTNEPWKLGSAVSSGCIRLSNEDIIDLYERTKLGATVIVRQ